MDEIISYYKPLGFTPLQAIAKLRTERPELKNAQITYAGRLDPMAEGLLLLLINEAVHRKEEFLRLDKTYKAKILLGFSSDSLDILGLVDDITSNYQFPDDKNFREIMTAVSSLIGIHKFPYPNFSSKTVDGKPLWQYAREGKLKNITIPLREMDVVNAEVLNLEWVPWPKIYQTILDTISLVNGEFRQQDILAQWAKINANIATTQTFPIITVAFDVSSGTYIRTIAHELGKRLQTKSLLLHLKRTRVGEFVFPSSLDQ